MSANSNAQRLVIVPDAEEFNAEPCASSTIPEPVVRSFCYGTGMEVVAGSAPLPLPRAWRTGEIA